MKRHKRYYDDLVIGKLEISSSLTVDEKEMLEFANQYDPQYFHADKQAAKSSRFGEVVASGQYTMVLWRQLDHDIAHDIAWICGIAWDNVRWPVAVKANDTLRATAKCIDKRLSKSDDTRGVVKYEYSLINQREQTVFSCISTNLVEVRQP
ncbi:MAG: MaoC/PaaZ C-terminal domain-containing protein [Gammaproteobacteria bacterium]